ncbi:Chromodomain-Helicase-Dna-Binding Protein 9 [Manis pentadactyla]|nr:Chromodomain-Helicase-Dna-Binding Protein 9 [Manis pentadactyla]
MEFELRSVQFSSRNHLGELGLCLLNPVPAGKRSEGTGLARRFQDKRRNLEPRGDALGIIKKWNLECGFLGQS